MPQSRTPKQPKYRRQTGRKGDPSFVELDEVRHYLATGLEVEGSSPSSPVAVILAERDT